MTEIEELKTALSSEHKYRLARRALREAERDARRVEELIETAFGHLGTALVQQAPSDDEIIMDHVKAAHGLLKGAMKNLRLLATPRGPSD